MCMYIFSARHNEDASDVSDGRNGGEPGGAAAGVHQRESARRLRASAEGFAIRRDGGPVSQYVGFLGLLGKTASHAVDRVELCDSRGFEGRETSTEQLLTALGSPGVGKVF